MRRAASWCRPTVIAIVVVAVSAPAPQPARADPTVESTSGPRVHPAAHAAEAATARHARLFLPWTQSIAVDAEPCGPPVAEACDGGAGWTAVCGGIGAIRDMVAPADGSGTVVVVGDGAGALRFGPADATGNGGDRARAMWSAQIGQDLTGLNSLAVERAPAGDLAGWAAGDHNQLVPLRDRCWRGFPWAGRNPAVTLRAIRVREMNGAPVGWAVGERAPGRAAVFDLPPSQRWTDHSDVGHSAPALNDVAIDPFPPGLNLRPGAWAVGGDPNARAGVFLRADGSRWRLAQRTADGWPREIVMGSDNAAARAFGVDWAHEAVLGWAYEPVSRTWMIDTGFARPGFDLVDAYSLPDAGRDDGGIWVGLAPALAPPPVPSPRDVLAVERFDWSAETWTTDRSPFTVGPAETDGSRAVAVVDVPSLAARLVVFAWNDGVWGFDPRRGAWHALRRRRRLAAFVPDAERGRLLALDPGGAQILHRDGDRIVPGPVLDGSLDERLAGAPLRATAMAGRGGVTWVVGAKGSSIRFRGPLARAEVFDLPGGARPDLVDVDVSPAGTAWALAVDAAGAPGVWTFGPRDAAWRPIDLGAGPAAGRPLAAIAALDDGSAWAVGDGTSVHIQPGCAFPPPDGCDCVGGEIPATLCRHALPPVGPANRPDRTHAIATRGGDQIWAAGDQIVHTATTTRSWSKLPALKSGADNLLRSGERIVDLAAGAPDDVWVVTHCGRHAVPDAIACGDDAPVLSRVFRFDGLAWREATRVNVAIHAVDIVAAGASTRTVWLTGDWTTLVRFPYAVPATESGPPR